MTAETTPTPIPEPQVPVDRHGSITLDVLAAQPGLRWLFTSPTRPATEAENARYESRRDNPEWAWLYELAAVPVPAPVAEPEPAGLSLGEQPHDPADCDRGGRPHLGPCAAGPIPLAELVPPAENDGLALAEHGHTDPAAVPEGGAAAVDLPRPELQRPPDSDGPAVDRAAGPGQPDCDPGSAAVQHVLAVMNARGGRPDQDDTQDGTAKPDQTAVMEPLTEAQIIAVTDSTEGDEQA